MNAYRWQIASRENEQLKSVKIYFRRVNMFQSVKTDRMIHFTSPYKTQYQYYTTPKCFFNFLMCKNANKKRNCYAIKLINI